MTDRPVEEPVEVSVVTDAPFDPWRPAGLELSLDPYPGVSAGVSECHDVIEVLVAPRLQSHATGPAVATPAWEAAAG